MSGSVWVIFKQETEYGLQTVNANSAAVSQNVQIAEIPVALDLVRLVLKLYKVPSVSALCCLYV